MTDNELYEKMAQDQSWPTAGPASEAVLLAERDAARAEAEAAEARIRELDACLRSMFDDQDITPESLAFWASEYKHAMQQLPHIRELEADLARVKAEAKTLISPALRAQGTDSDERERIRHAINVITQNGDATMMTKYEAMTVEIEALRQQVKNQVGQIVNLREALKKVGHARGCKINPGGKIMEALGFPDPHPCTCGAYAALSSTAGHDLLERLARAEAILRRIQSEVWLKRDIAEQVQAALKGAALAAMKEGVK